MNTDRIKEIQRETAYPESRSVQQALLKVWNECEQSPKTGQVDAIVIGSKYGLEQFGRCESHSCESVESGRCNRRGELVRIFQGTTNNSKLNDGHWEQHSCEEAIKIDEEQGFNVVKVF